MVAGCQPRNTSVPIELIGVWETADCRYADRFFEITRSSIALGTGDGSVETYPIIAVDRVGDRDPVLHTISYRDRDGQEFRLSFYFEPRDPGVIRFKHQKDIPWTKARS